MLSALLAMRGQGRRDHLFYPVHTLACYVEFMAPIRCTKRLFVCFGDGVVGTPSVVLTHSTRDVVSGLAQWCVCQEHMYDSFLEDAMSLHKVLSVGHFRLLFQVRGDMS